MTDLRKAAEMALEVFEHLSKGESPAITKGELVYEVAALRQALAQPEKPPVKSYCGGKPNYCTPEVTPEVTGEVLAEPNQEPEWIEDGFGTMWQKCGKKDCGKFVVKIGKVDCWNGDCPEEKNNG